MAKKEVKTLLLRLSPSMWDAITAWAEDEFRSVNGQIEYVLREALVKQGRLSRKEAGQTLPDEDDPVASVQYVKNPPLDKPE